MEIIAMILGCWLLTYLLHSTAFYVLAKLLVRTSAFAHTQAQELLWKIALGAGIFTASIQVFTGLGVFTSLVDPVAGYAAHRPALVQMNECPVPQSGEQVVPYPETDSAVYSSNIVDIAHNETASTDSSIGPFIAPIGSDQWFAGILSLDLLPSLLVFGTWLPICIFLFIRLLVQKYRFTRAIAPRRKVTNEALLYQLFKLCNAAGIDQKIVLTCSEKLCSPLAIGRSEICLPTRGVTDLPPDQQQSMLAHELAHLVRKDYRWLHWFNFLETVFFFQPFNRLMRKELQEVVEQNCDAWAIARTGKAKPLAACLIKVAEWITEPQALRFASGMALNHSSLRYRIEHILKNKYFTQKESNRMKIIVLLIAAFVFTTLIVPGKTWVSLSFAHNGKLGNYFNHQELNLGGPSDPELAELPPPDAPDFEAQIAAMADLEAAQAEAAVHAVDWQPQGDTLRFGKNFMMITFGRNHFEMYQENKRISESDYEKYKDVFVVKDESVEILAKDGVKISAGREPWEVAHAWPNDHPMAVGSGLISGGGPYIWEENGETVMFELDPNNELKYLRIDDKTIAEAEYPKYKPLVDRIKATSKKQEAEMGKLADELSRQQKKLMDLSMKLNDEAMAQHQAVMKQAEQEMQRQQMAMQDQERHAQIMSAQAEVQEKKMTAMSQKLKEALISDDLIKSKSAHFEIRLSRQGFFVDNQKQSDELYQNTRNWWKK